MRQYLKQTFNRIRHKMTFALKRVPILKQYALNQQFHVERQLIAKTHETDCLHPSILYFSVNRAATQYVKSILRQCAAVNGLTNVGLHDYAFHSAFPYLNTISRDDMQSYSHIFKPQGYAYSVFGGMVDGIPNLEQYRTILLVRDPRDILVSAYYAVAYSHSKPGQSEKQHQFMVLRQQAQSSTIDHYVRQQCDRLYEVFERYQRLLVQPYPTVYITRFEEMIADFPQWLSSLLEYCDLKISDRLSQQLVDEHLRLTPRTENVQRHQRKGKVGDYLEKLTPETIEYINSKFSETLRFFNYH